MAIRRNVSRISLAAAMGIRFAVRSFRIYVDQAHLHGAQRILKIAVATISLVTQPLAFGAPVDFFGLPHVRTAAAKPKRLEAHGLQSNVARKNHRSPRRFCARTSA